MSAVKRAVPAAPLARVRRRDGDRIPPSVAVSIAFLALVALCAVAPGLLAPLDPARIQADEALQGASSAHLLGTDDLGRDILSRVVAGARSAIIGPMVVAVATVVLSTALALAAGYYGGRVDGVIGRAADLVYAVPALILAIVVVGLFGGGYALAVAVLVVFNTPTALRILRATVIEHRRLPYVEAAETLGVPPRTVMLRHLLPNLEPMIVTTVFLGFTYGMVELSALSFLGLGVPPGSSDWGRMLSENRVQVFQNVWAALAPGIALVGTVIAANLVGDWSYRRLERRRAAR